MEITFDPAKDKANRRKHGISLARAEEFDFATAVIRVDDRIDFGEVRYRALGFLDGRLFAMVFAEHDDQLRAISLRKAERSEESEYADG